MSRLRKIRKEQNVKQSEIAKYLNVTEATYSRYETGKTNMSPETLSKICAFFDVSADYLLGLIDYPLTIAENSFRKSLESQDDDILDKFTLELNNKNITEEEAKIVLDLLNILRKS